MPRIERARNFFLVDCTYETSNFDYLWARQAGEIARTVNDQALIIFEQIFDYCVIVSCIQASKWPVGQYHDGYIDIVLEIDMNQLEHLLRAKIITRFINMPRLPKRPEKIK